MIAGHKVPLPKFQPLGVAVVNVRVSTKIHPTNSLPVSWALKVDKDAPIIEGSPVAFHKSNKSVEGIAVPLLFDFVP